MPASPFLYAEHEGASALVHAYLATDYDDARFLSVGGPAEAVRAVLAAVASTSPLSLIRRQGATRHEVSLLRPDPTVKWRLTVRRLPCGQVHGLLAPDTSVAAARHQFTLLLPRSEEAEGPGRLLRLLDARTMLPLHPTWASWLWTLCEELDWLTALQGEGGWVGWDVHWTERTLQEQLTEAIQTRALRVP
jgi:hypothetical protein